MSSFSIIVPTRNRPRELERTLVGLALLEHENFEVVVSDNSSEQFREENRQLVERHLVNLNHRYVNPPGELNMVTHWEFALGLSDADFSGVVTDRMTLVSDALKEVERVAAATGADTVSYGNTTLGKFAKGLNRLDRLLSKKPERQSAEALLLEFSRSKLGSKNPRLLNSFASRELLTRVKSEYGAIFGGISPDYNFMFKALSVCDQPVHIRRPLLVNHAVGVSNGMSLSRFRDNQHSTDFLRLLDATQQQCLEFGPIVHETHLLPNSILREYTMISQESVGRRFPSVEPDPFVEACMESLKRAENKRVPEFVASRERLVRYAIENLGCAPDLSQLSRISPATVASSLKHSISGMLTKGPDDITTSRLGKIMREYTVARRMVCN